MGIFKLPLIGKGFSVLFSMTLAPGMVEKGLYDAFGPNTNSIPPGFIDRYRIILTDPGALRSFGLSLDTFNKELGMQSRKYKEIKIPVRILQGDKDNLKEGIRKLEKVLPDVKVTLLTNTGHMVFYADPETASKMLIEAAVH